MEKASELGDLNVMLMSDKQIEARTGKLPKFSADERLYAAQALRYVKKAVVDSEESFPEINYESPDIWAVHEADDTPEKKEFREFNNIDYNIIKEEELEGFPLKESKIDFKSKRKRVVVTGCYDWFHTGHIRFFEEAAEAGDLYVVVGHDENLKLLKGEGHPQFPQDERRYMVQAIKYVKAAMISTGNGWLDAEPEIEKIKPDIYAINSDSGGKDKKQEFCDKHGIELLIFERTPKEGLPKRISTNLRGF